MANDSTPGPTEALRHARELEALYTISRILASDSLQKQALAETLDVLREQLDMSRGTVTLLAPGDQELLIEAADDLPRRQRESVRFRRGEGITGRVLASGKAMIVPKISEEPAFLDRLHRRKGKSDEEISFLCAPILIGSEVAGTISVDLAFDKGVSLDEILRVLTIVASMIANDVAKRRELAAEKHLLEAENTRLRNELTEKFRPENIIGNSGAMREVYQSIHQVASSDTTVLIRGESGTGKELVAHAIHYASPRAGGAFIKVNCAALSEGLLESELFGHEKGAFTGAIQTRKGRIEEADGGTLFLDEIGDFSPATQVKLLRALQDRQFERVGSNQTRKSNVRVICATNRDLEEAVAGGDFRQDLYYRINVFPILLPPLRERKDDILLLADHFVERYSKRMAKDVRRISTPAINMMVMYHWPGNVRELENCIERAVLLSNDGVIHGHHLPPTLQTSDFSETAGTGSLSERVALYEKDIIVDAFKRTYGNASAAARDLGTSARILRYKANHLGIDPSVFRQAK